MNMQVFYEIVKLLIIIVEKLETVGSSGFAEDEGVELNTEKTVVLVNVESKLDQSNAAIVDTSNHILDKLERILAFSGG